MSAQRAGACYRFCLFQKRSQRLLRMCVMTAVFPEKDATAAVGYNKLYSSGADVDTGLIDRIFFHITSYFPNGTRFPFRLSAALCFPCEDRKSVV